MQGVYYRENAKTPWVFLGKTRSVVDADKKMRRKAFEKGVGVFVYVEGQNLTLTAWSLRTLGRIRLLRRRIAKSFLDHWKPIRQNGRRAWSKNPPEQLTLPLMQSKRVKQKGK